MTKSEVRPRGRTRTARRIGGVVAALALASGLVVGPASLPALAYPAQLLPTTGAYFGSWVAPRGGESVQQAIARVESEVGRKLAIDHQYYKWNSNIPTSHQTWDVNNGRIPFVNWNAANTGGSIVRWSAIANGSQDAWIRSRADAFKAFGKPIYLTFHHEPEDDLSRFGTAADYAAAFRHIVTVFRSRGVTNVAFVWTMMSWTFDPRSGRDPNSYYPGDSYVDFIGSDGYNWYPGRAGDVWNSFATIFTATRAFALAHRKPWMAVEYGVQEDRTIPGRKGQWFRDALTTIKSWPELKAVMYYDQNKVYPWQTDTSSTSISGYRTLANDPYLKPGSVGGATAPPTPSPTPTPTPPPTGSTVYNSLDAGPDGAPVTASTSSPARDEHAVQRHRDDERRLSHVRQHPQPRGVLRETCAHVGERFLLPVERRQNRLVRPRLRLVRLAAVRRPSARPCHLGRRTPARDRCPQFRHDPRRRPAEPPGPQHDLGHRDAAVDPDRVLGEPFDGHGADPAVQHDHVQHADAGGDIGRGEVDRFQRGSVPVRSVRQPVVPGHVLDRRSRDGGEHLPGALRQEPLVSRRAGRRRRCRSSPSSCERRPATRW